MSDSREDQAASKIQALHRGKQARKDVTVKKHREDSAATKIQAIQRGRRSRRTADEKRKELELFVLPALRQTSQYVDVRVSLVALRQRVKAWDQFTEQLHAAGIIDTANGRVALSTEGILYGTDGGDAASAASSSFPNAFSQKLFDSIVAYDTARVLATKRRADHEAIEAAKPPPPPPPARPEGAEDDEDEAPASPSKTKKQLREEAEQRKADRERLRAVMEAEHDAACRLKRLENVLKLRALRIPIVPVVTA